MKIVETTVAKTVVVKEPVTQYIAEDGKVFNSEKECLAHENEKKCREHFKELTIASIPSPAVFNIYDADILLVKLETKEDVDTIVQYSELNCGTYCDSYVAESLPKVVKSLPCRVIYFENDGFADIYSADGLLNECLDIARTLVK